MVYPVSPLTVYRLDILELGFGMSNRYVCSFLHSTISPTEQRRKLAQVFVGLVCNFHVGQSASRALVLVLYIYYLMISLLAFSSL
jgi:hypothetical protein